MIKVFLVVKNFPKETTKEVVVMPAPRKGDHIFLRSGEQVFVDVVMWTPYRNYVGHDDRTNTCDVTVVGHVIHKGAN